MIWLLWIVVSDLILYSFFTLFITWAIKNLWNCSEIMVVCWNDNKKWRSSVNIKIGGLWQMWLNHSARSMTPCELISNFVYWHGHLDGKVKHWFPYSGQLTCMIIHTDIYMYNVTNWWNVALALKVLKMNYIWQSQLFQRNRGIIRNISSFLNANLEHSILRRASLLLSLCQLYYFHLHPENMES